MGIVVSRADKCALVGATSSEVQNTVSQRELNGTIKPSQDDLFVSSRDTIEAVLLPALPVKIKVERGYVTPQQVYNFLNAEGGHPLLHDPSYMLILDCRSAERYKESHLVTARASVTVIHPELGCLMSCVQLQEFSIILLYAEQGHSP
ncbi:hypothetical protein DNTS_007166, partial [Danionella cerebrum]